MYSLWSSRQATRGWLKMDRCSEAEGTLDSSWGAWRARIVGKVVRSRDVSRAHGRRLDVGDVLPSGCCRM